MVIRECIYEGAQTRYFLTCNQRQIQVTVSNDHAMDAPSATPGEEVTVYVPPGALVVLEGEA
jgi:hypothetical protein